MAYDVYGLSTWNIDCGLAKFMNNLCTGLSPTALPEEVIALMIASINGSELKNYDSPASDRFAINKKDPSSWIEVGHRIGEQISIRGNPALIIGQHEFGLESKEGVSHSYVDFMNAIKETARSHNVKEEDFIFLTYLHTLKTQPKDFQKKGIIELSEASDGLNVMIPHAKKILSDVYGITSNVFDIDHGIRTIDISESDRLKIKGEMGLEDTVALLSMGYLGPNKGLEGGLEAYSMVVKESFTPEVREKVVYLIVGDCHKNNTEGDKYNASIRNKANELGLTWGNAHYGEDGKRLIIRESNDPKAIGKGPKSCDVVFVRKRTSETEYKRYLAAANIVVLAYPDQDQISSGIITDAVGAGRCVISTGFEHPLYLLSPKGTSRGDVLEELAEKRIYGMDNPAAIGSMVDLNNKDYIKDLAALMHYYIEHKEPRLAKEKNARLARMDMYWPTIARKIINVADHIRYEKAMRNHGRGPDVPLNKGSSLATIVRDIMHK